MASFLAGYRGATRDAYALDLLQFVAWRTEHRLALFSAKRADIECYARALGLHRASLSTLFAVVKPWSGSKGAAHSVASMSRGGMSAWTVLVVAVLTVGILTGCSDSQADMAPQTCAAVWNWMNATEDYRGTDLAQINFDADHDSGKLAADARALTNPPTSAAQQTALTDVEHDCDAAGHHYNWSAAQGIGSL